MKTTTQWLLVLQLALAGSLPAAGVYTWTDEQGRVHYGDRPAGDNATEIRIRDMPPPTQDPETKQQRLDKQRRLLNLYEQERAEKQEAAQRAKQEKERRKRNCSKAKDHLVNLQRATGLYKLDKQGKRIYLSDTERADKERKARENIRKWCN